MTTSPAEQSAVSSEPGRDESLPTTRGDRRAEKPAPNRLLIVVGGCCALALLIVIFIFPAPKHHPRQKAVQSDGANSGSEKPSSLADKSSIPITDANLKKAKPAAEQTLAEADIERTATTTNQVPSPPAPQFDNASEVKGSIGSIPAFSNNETNPNPQVTGTDTTLEPAADDKHVSSEPPSSLVFARKAPSPSSAVSLPAQDFSGGLPPGFALRARLADAATTAIQMPVVAVVEYNYEHNGIIVVPAGTKVIGRIEQADASGYMSIRFDTLLIQNASPMAIDAVATDLSARPIRGRVEGKNTGKQTLIKAISGIGQIGSMFVGRGSLGQPLSESDLVRERIGQNIAQASDQQLNSLVVTQHVVVSVPANTAINVVLQHSTRTQSHGSTQIPAGASEQQTMEQLRQLLQLQRELSAVEQQH